MVMDRILRWGTCGALISACVWPLPTWGKSPTTTEFPDLSLANTPAIEWAVKVKKRSGFGRGLYQFASPVAAGDRLYVGTAGGRVYCIDRRQGERLWSFATEGPVIGPVALAGEQLFVGDAKGVLYALAAHDGASIWRVELGSEIAAAPLATDGLVYVATTQGELIAVDRSTGARKWRTSRRMISAPFAVRGSASPILVEKRLVVGYPDGTLVAHDPASGAVVWATRLALPTAVLQDVDTTPTPVGTLIIAGAVEGVLAGVDPRTGQIRWRAEVGTPNAIGVHNGTVYVAGAGRVVALDAERGEIRWKNRLPAEETAGPAVVGEKLLLMTTSDQLYLLSRADGVVIGKRHLGTGSYGALAVEGDRAYLLTNAGNVVALRVP